MWTLLSKIAQGCLQALVFVHTVCATRGRRRCLRAPASACACACVHFFTTPKQRMCVCARFFFFFWLEQWLARPAATAPHCLGNPAQWTGGRGPLPKIDEQVSQASVTKGRHNLVRHTSPNSRCVSLPVYSKVMRDVTHSTMHHTHMCISWKFTWVCQLANKAASFSSAETASTCMFGSVLRSLLFPGGRSPCFQCFHPALLPSFTFHLHSPVLSPVLFP